MSTELLSSGDGISLLNIVRMDGQKWPELPPCSILINYVKTLEIELRKRRLIGSHALDSFNPLWFLAQTERDVYLWRHGFSITQQHEFEFWVDLPGLIKKREQQLGIADLDNPFTNPDWSLTQGVDSANLDQEMEYLKSLSCALSKINRHAHIISRMVSVLRLEVEGYKTRKVVVLPEKKRPS